MVDTSAEHAECAHPDAGGLDAYVAAWHRRLAAEREQEEARTRAAWQEAERLARILRDDFGATRVWVFGSLAQHVKGLRRFRLDSDIDLAVEGIPAERFFAAYGRLLASSEFSIDLIDLVDCSPALRESVRRDGIPLA